MRLLLVEDDTMIAESLRDQLRAEHYAVDWVGDGEAAQAALLVHRYDLVLLDLGLPKRDGMAILEGLRRRKDRTPVLVATGQPAHSTPSNGVQPHWLAIQDFSMRRSARRSTMEKSAS